MNRTRRDLSDEDQDLWRYVTRDVKPYRARAPASPRRPERDLTAAPRPAPAAPAARRASGAAALKVGETAGIDRRTARRFKRGELPLDGRLDLHGLTLAEAEAATGRFILSSAAAGRRCLLIVTGKGERWAGELGGERRGGIRREAPIWLSQSPLRSLILAVTPAQARHGGSGALYVLLRRRPGD